ncbi:tetratricopeptide repeat protein [Roseiarcus sp.]|uniref:tetratricopeptide repeat protein n=1 Tax=Roseiarcus sp. TaxID=1969460 RepID=UPI003D0CFB36
MAPGPGRLRHRSLQERALAIYEKALGLEHPSASRARRNLALLLLATGRAPEALTLGEAALAAHEKSLGPRHRWTADSARITADALKALGRDDAASELRRRYRLEDC